ncbi:hypothetical protein [Lusitaniella coriacea]|uniref:hypothetical protein n=1 Tax=Lusitaniella coriacea TaxID=1983105 RepID=UPI003CF82CE2
MFTGIEISESSLLVKEIQKKLNPSSLKPIDLLHTWEKRDLQWCYRNLIDLYDEFYIFYEHPVHNFKNKLLRTKKDECMKFILEYIKPDEGTGVDVTISSLDMKSMIVCNHDGDIFSAIHNPPRE